jgi:hypothetical protein
MPDRKKLFGCAERAKKYVEVEEENGKEYLYWNCPLHFVSGNVWLFLRELKYHRDYPSAGMPNYRNCNPKWIDAVNYYENKIAEYVAKKD